MTPIVLSANVSLAAGASGAPDLQKLVPPMNRPMLVHDVSFTIRTGSAAFFVGSVSDFQFGGIIRARLMVGRYAITDGFVPLTNFAPLYARGYDKDNPFFDNVLDDALVNNQGEFYNHWRWPLPKPLYVAPGEGIQPIFTRSTIYDSILHATIVSGSFDVRISVHGELLFQPPDRKTRDVPYVSCFTPSSLLADDAYLRSTEQDLRNVLDKPLQVQRFVGHITVPTEAGTCITPGAGTDAKIELADSLDHAITFGDTSNRIGWNSVFPEQRRAWTFGAILAPSSKYPCAVVSDATNSLITVSMVGSREEEV